MRPKDETSDFPVVFCMFTRGYCHVDLGKTSLIPKRSQ